MVIAMYKSNSNAQPEHIRVHKNESDGRLRVEAIGISYAHDVGGVYDTIEEVEAFLGRRDRVRGYTKVI